MSECEDEERYIMIGGDDSLGGRTVARNVYLRLLLARKLKKFDATKALEAIRQFHGS